MDLLCGPAEHHFASRSLAFFGVLGVRWRFSELGKRFALSGCALAASSVLADALDTQCVLGSLIRFVVITGEAATAHGGVLSR
jgi:hypothetical protein